MLHSYPTVCQVSLAWIIAVSIVSIFFSLQRMESTDIGEGGRGERGPGGVVEGEKHLRMVYYYYINYKQFVNVVKYKLDKMRKAIEAEEKKVCEGEGGGCEAGLNVEAGLMMGKMVDGVLV